MSEKVDFNKSVLIIGATLGATEYWKVSNFRDKDIKYQEEINILLNKLVDVDQVLVGDGVLEDYLQNHLLNKFGYVSDDIVDYIADMVRYYLPDKKNLETITTVKFLTPEKSDLVKVEDKLLETLVDNIKLEDIN